MGRHCKKHNWEFGVNSNYCKDCHIDKLTKERDKLKEESIQWEKESLVELIKERDELKEIATKYEDRYFSEKKVTDELTDELTDGIWSQWELDKAKIESKNMMLTMDNINQRTQLARCVEVANLCLKHIYTDPVDCKVLFEQLISDLPKSAHLDAAIIKAAEKHEIENNKPKIFCNCSICKAVKARQEMK